MITWVLIVILVIFGIVALKLNHMRHRVFIILIIAIALFLVISITYVNNKNQLDFSSTEGFMNAGRVYMGWLANGFTNLKDITGHAIKMDWTSTNGTFLKNNNKTAESIKEKVT